MRNTPTCVGKTQRKTAALTLRKKHPHVRGEDSFMAGDMLCALETPPRAWGRPLRRPHVRQARGNTPTCVGKTQHMACKRIYRQKHPHVRGEDHEPAKISPICRETPPRAWGRLHARRRKGTYGGNTPTCVGKTVPSSRGLDACWKHPHVRGEDWQGAGSAGNVPETPPRAWGRPQRMYVMKRRFRNTPTCVGKTFC